MSLAVAATSTTHDIKLELLSKWGSNCNSFLSLYPGFLWHYCKNPSGETYGAIPYVETGKLWFAAGDPLGAKDKHKEMLHDFYKAASLQNRKVAFIPVNEVTSILASELGYGRVAIGSEPVFDLNKYHKSWSQHCWASVVPASMALKKRGAVVQEFRPETITLSEKQEMDEIIHEWITTRKMSQLSFLNQVDPWGLSHEKKYFAVRCEGRILAFVAAIPIKARNGWYLIDVMRHAKTHAGTVELLLLESMRLLKASGYDLVSLGIAPLSRIEGKNTWQNYVYEHMNQFYNFKSLYEFKEKLKPTSYEPAYMLVDPSGFSLQQAYGLLKTFVPNGVFSALKSIATRLWDRTRFFKAAHMVWAPNIVTLCTPEPTFKALAQRLKFTWNLALVMPLSYFIVPSAMVPGYAFTAEHFRSSPLVSLFAPQFLHWDNAHLVSNMLQILFVTGTLEIFLGSSLTMLCFFVPSMITNAVFALFVNIQMQADIGASLGIWGTMGALAAISKRKRILFAAGILVGCAYAASQGEVLALNHVLALLIGALLVKTTI